MLQQKLGRGCTLPFGLKLLNTTQPNHSKNTREIKPKLAVGHLHRFDTRSQTSSWPGQSMARHFALEKEK